MFLEHQIRMISELSCDTVDWSNDAENCFAITRISPSLFKSFYTNSSSFEESCE